jgi:hypothetical protein
MTSLALDFTELDDDDRAKLPWPRNLGFHELGYVIDCDFNGVWAWSFRPERKAWCGNTCGEGPYWYGCRPLPEDLIRDFNRWQDRFEFGPLDRIAPGEDGVEGFSWRRFHCDGLRLAKRLKLCLGPEFVVIYAKPWEDRTGLTPLNLLIRDDLRPVRYVHVPWVTPGHQAARSAC